MASDLQEPLVWRCTRKQAANHCAKVQLKCLTPDKCTTFAKTVYLCSSERALYSIFICCVGWFGCGDTRVDVLAVSLVDVNEMKKMRDDSHLNFF